MKQLLNLALGMLLCGQAAAGDATVAVTRPPTSTAASAGDRLGLAANSNFPDDVVFQAEPLYPARNNQARAQVSILFSCVPVGGGGRIVPCYISTDTPVGRQDSGGHSLHPTAMPPGRFTPSAGWVDTADGYFRTTYYASEVSGVIDVKIHCQPGFGGCQDGTTVIGVGFDSLADLGPGTGYVLTGDKSQHPSNHWGSPAFVTAIQQAATLFAADYPNDPLQYNDMSLKLGGVFDVETPTETGYDWTPPHKSHRIGTNLGMSILAGRTRQALVRRLFNQNGIHVLPEDAYHWHMTFL